jgi:hypothetical protein
MRTDEATWEDSIDIPLRLYSTESLQFVGFKRCAAEEIMQRFRHALLEHSNKGIEFFAFMRGFIEGGSENVLGAYADWDSALKQMGMKRKVRAGILNPDFDHFRLSGSARSWAPETVEDGWMFLTGLDEAVKRNEKKIANGFQGDGLGIRVKRRAEMGSESD